MRESNPSFMNGVPELLVLRLIREREMYGYELVQAIRARSAEAIALGEGVIYPVLHALEASGALASRRKNVNGRSRVYYSITAVGVSRLEGLTDSWTKLTDAVRTVLAGAPDAEPV